ncbi:hypothetical protein AGDE_10221 [Angomonas deanei]|nr:hypothetical protein AGDE_10221 [Angomonas deanei]|eukprot:EPY28909.1 hypothetical protein AGDE_10221 [Angomonas deanei]
MEFKGSVTSVAEAENLVCQIKSFSVKEVGSSGWKKQRKCLEILNMSAHSNAAQNKDDYVKEFLVQHGKLSDVLNELLVMEVWRQRVLPSVLEPLATNPSAPYIYCNYESILVNLLECVCYHEEVITGFGDDLLELIDYCWRQVYRFFSLPVLKNCSQDFDPKAALKQSPLDTLNTQLSQNLITRGMACISILWFIVDRINDLPLSVSNSVFNKNDLPVGISEVLLLQPWLRRSPSKVEKYNNGQYVAVEGDEVARVCIPEAHCWFMIHKLLCDKDCRTQYQYTTHKKEIILQIKRFMNDTLTDQIPPLQNVQRALEELSFMQPPTGTEEKFKSKLVIEQVPRLMSRIDHSSCDWKQIGNAMKEHLVNANEKREDAMWLSEIFSLMYA